MNRKDLMELIQTIDDEQIEEVYICIAECINKSKEKTTEPA